MSRQRSSPVDLAALRHRLAARRGAAYWRSLEELAETPEFLAYLHGEFPRLAEAAATALDRRRFLQLMAASLALGGLAACGPEPDQRQLWPYVVQPPGVVPGKARYFATATSLDGFGTGVLVKHEMGRPLKVEGNPDHPASLGGTSAIDQASILGLYDPNRAQSILGAGEIRSWEALVTLLIERRNALAARRGAGLRLLTGTVTSPTLAEQIAALQHAFPEMQWHQWEPLHRDAQREGARLAFGRAVETIYDVAQADIVLGIESDLLSGAPGHLRYARDFARRRRAAEAKAGMSRVYALEATPTLLGAKADHRLALKPDELGAALRFIAAALKAGPSGWGAAAPRRELLETLVADLQAHRGRGLVHAGREQPAEIHAVVHAINGALGNFGHAVQAIEPVEAAPTAQAQSLAALVEAMAGGKVDTLLVLDVNAAYGAPGELDFAGALGKVPLSIYLGAYRDETATLCRWHVPATHAFEAWGDVRAHDGTVTIQQPQARPLYGGHSAHELLAVLLGDTRPEDRALLRAHWQRAAGAGDFEGFWTAALRAGVVANTAAPRLAAAIRPDYAAALPRTPSAAAGLTLLFRGDPGLWDGRFAENAWLQEMPRPFTRLTWDNAAMLAPATAQRLGLADGDIVEITRSGRRLRAPVWILPGQAPDCLTLPLGYGRRETGPVAEGAGFDAYSLRPASDPWQAGGARLARAGSAPHRFASEQHHALIEGRELVREFSLAAFLADPDSVAAKSSEETLYPPYRYEGIAWAMSISLNACIGCQACVIACQAENNIPVVGKEQVAIGRVMHWLRIDRYYRGDIDNPEVAFQPVPCMHCEDAPCEVVCPVQATVHDHEGLNVMVYNRCVGTRFCSNNCPYKVRRFNFLGYTAENQRPRESWNPDVTVRGRGVMEKCTYCVQRTREAMIAADRENRTLRDGEVVTACQQACPTQAIAFGDRNDKASAVAARKASPLDYALLDELNTRPRTTYEAAIRNPNPGLKSS
jgi:molybdopterin-containing oxidoreductase family iron-sulfur binding subunit